MSSEAEELRREELDLVLAAERIKRMEAVIKESLMGSVDAISLMSMMHDEYTVRHQSRVAHLSGAIGKELGLSVHQQKGLILAGYLHDVGKVGVTTEILTRDGKLSKNEYETVQKHAEAGGDVLKNIKFPWPVAEAVHQHHERMDGKGYPRGLQGEQILLEARIVAVADVVDAMSWDRPYRNPPPGLEAALEEIGKGAGKKYDADAAIACIELFLNKSFMVPEWRKHAWEEVQREFRSWDI